MGDIKSKAYNAVKAIVGDITDRRGIGDEFELMDNNTRNEMLEHWKQLIITYMSE